MAEPTLKKHGIDWGRLIGLFESAMDLPTAERHAFAVDQCGGDAEMLRELAALLDAEQASERKGFLRNAIFKTSAAADLDDAPAPEHIGEYRVIRELGRGGMGVVYLADHRELGQRAAVKVIKRGMDTDEVQRRFRIERQVLAALEHPHIARLLNGGTTDDGRPYFVMEYVDGSPITSFCDANRLSIDDRLRLFEKVCSAVSYAHKNLVVHRDIKPGNFLVGEDGEPKLLDFGISKILSDQGGVTMPETALGMRMLTPEYASPEQITGGAITTASDVYSLGVLLYELLSGHRPIEVTGRARAEISRFISEVEPDAPSTAAIRPDNTGRAVSPETLAENRGDRPEKLRRRLRGDLDNIVLMSLRKEPERRYGSVEQFAEDIDRHLTGMPVMARPASFGYLASKFVERHRPQMVAAAAAIAAIVIGFGAALWQWNAAAAERDMANERFNQVRQLSNSLISGWDDGLDETQISHAARARLIGLSAEFLDSLAAQTREPELLAELAEAYLKLGHEFAYQSIDMPRAANSFSHAESIARRITEDNAANVGYRDLLARVLAKQDEFFGASDLEASMRSRLERLSLRERNLELEPDSETVVRWHAAALADVANGMRLLGRNDEASQFFQRSIDGYRRRIELLETSSGDPDRNLKIASSYSAMSNHFANRLRDLDAGDHSIRAAIEVLSTRFHPTQRPNNWNHVAAGAYYILAAVLEKKGDPRGSEEALDTVVKLSRDWLKKEPSAFFARKEYDSLLSIAEIKAAAGDTNAAIELIGRSIDLRKAWVAGDANRDHERSRRSGAIHSLAVGRLMLIMGDLENGRKYLNDSISTLDEIVSATGGANAQAVRELGGAYLSLADSYAGIRPCTIAERPFGGIAEQVEHCRPKEILTDRRQPDGLRSAAKYYRLAGETFSRLETGGSLTAADRELLAFARGRIAGSGELSQIKY